MFAQFLAFEQLLKCHTGVNASVKTWVQFDSVTMIKRTFIGLFTGLLGGAIFGAVVILALFLPQYLFGHSFFERLKHLVFFACLFVGVYGIVPCCIIGFIVGTFALC